MEITMCYVFGVLIVFLFSIEYYKRAKYNFKGLKKGDEFYAKSVDPLPAERLTNRPIYFFSYSLFVVFSQAVFFSLTMTISFFVPLVGLKESLPRESLILASALLTIGFLPNMPFLQDMIRKTRTIFHRAAKVPIHGRLIFNILYQNDPEFIQATIQGIIDKKWYGRTVASDDFDKSDNSIDGLWAKIVYLYFSIDDMTKDPAQKFSLRGNEDYWSQITDSFERVCPAIDKYKSGELNEGEDYNLFNQLRILQYQLYTIISSGVVMTYKNHPDYSSALKHFGYTYDPPRIFTFSMKRIVFMSLACGLGITVGVVVSFLASIYLSDHIPWLQKLDAINSLKKFLYYGIPFTIVPPLCVLLMKRFMSENLDLWHAVSFENAYQRLSDYPWHIYTYITFISYFVGMAVLMSLQVLRVDEIQIAQFFDYGFIKKNMAWPIFSAFVCLFVSIRSDTPYFPKKKNIGKALIKDTGSAILMGALALVAVLICLDLSRSEFILIDLLNWEAIKPEIKSRLFSFSIMGFCIGFFMSYTTRFKSIKDDRRKNPRFNTKTSCKMNVGGYAAVVKFRNISVGGVRVFTPETVAIEENQPVTLSFASDYQFVGRIAAVKKRLLSITFNENLGYDTINSIMNYNQKRRVNFKYAA